jgi:LysM repeat protein
MTFVLARHVIGWSFAVVLLLTVAACGGGGASKGSGARVTDPAKVPSSTPIGDGVTRYLIAGDTVSVSGGTPAVLSGIPGTPAPAATYTVKSGDTCAAIAAQFKITTDDLLKNNRTIDAGCTNLHAGDTLRIPASTPAAGSTTTLGSGPTPRPTGKSYTVASGDTCDAIARSYGVTLQNLNAANGNMDCTKLQIGQVVNIPQ